MTTSTLSHKCSEFRRILKKMIWEIRLPCIDLWWVSLTANLTLYMQTIWKMQNIHKTPVIAFMIMAAVTRIKIRL